MAGSITAALFLAAFVEQTTAWAHLDLYAWNPKDRPGRPKGGEATALRALLARDRAPVSRAMIAEQPGSRADYRIFYEIPTRWMDNDVYGHVNNVHYYSYLRHRDRALSDAARAGSTPGAAR